MRKSKFTYIFYGIILLVGLLFGYMNYKNYTQIRQKEMITVQDRQKKEITVGKTKLTVEVVLKPESTTLGLSGRDAIGADGMLFLLPQKRVATFWMKEMKFDIDIIWIANGKIVGIAPNVPKPAPETQLEDLPLYSSPEAVQAVLEVPAGQAQAYNLEVGDTVEIPFLQPR